MCTAYTKRNNIRALASNLPGPSRPVVRASIWQRLVPTAGQERKEGGTGEAIPERDFTARPGTITQRLALAFYTSLLKSFGNSLRNDPQIHMSINKRLHTTGPIILSPAQWL